MKTKIRVLSEKIINQIAAGEVVENPSSALKELIENGIDAGARKIWIDVQGGGFTQFTVSDDGEGMSRDDALLSFERHATSKVAAYEDLLTLRTMGFRGEALSSIAAVAKVTLTTFNGEEGTFLEICGGKMLRCEGAGRQRGTTLTVQSLFFNTPARKKFQVTSGASQSAIVKMVHKMAFAQPEIQFSLKCGDKEVISFSHTSLLERGRFLLQGMKLREIEVTQGAFRLVGVIGEPSEARGNRSGQFLVINHRCVEAFEVSEAVKEGFATRLGIREFPCFALHLFLPPEEVDVNVHPQKLKVRFAEKEGLMAFIREGVKGCLTPAPSYTPSKAFSEFTKEKWDQGAFSFPLFEEKELPLRQGFNLEEMEPISLFSQFLLLRGEDLFFMHLPRVHELLMEKKELSPKGLQQLIEPLRIELSLEEMERVTQNLEQLNALGVRGHPFGEKMMVIEAIAQDLDIKKIKEILRAIGGGSSVAATLAKGKKYRFSFEEAKGMLHVLKKRPDQVLSLDGKPLFVRLSQHAITNLFI